MEDTNIPDQLTYHEPEPRKRTEPKDNLYRTAQIISAIFTPFLLPFVAFVLLFTFTYLRILPLQYKLIVLGIVYCFTILLPMLSIYLIFVPYALTILSYIGCVITMYRYHLPRYMGGIIIATLLCMVICALINIKWKISTHTASSGMMVGGLLSYSFIFQFNPIGWLCAFILLAGMLGSARIIVRQHTLNEVMGGFFTGLFCGVIGILFI